MHYEAKNNYGVDVEGAFGHSNFLHSFSAVRCVAFDEQGRAVFTMCAGKIVRVSVSQNGFEIEEVFDLLDMEPEAIEAPKAALGWLDALSTRSRQNFSAINRDVVLARPPAISGRACAVYSARSERKRRRGGNEEGRSRELTRCHGEARQPSTPPKVPAIELRPISSRTADTCPAC
jgi:hypothetical protein